MIRNNAIYLSGGVGAGALGYGFHFASGRLLGPSQYSIVASAVASLYLVTLPAIVLQLVTVRFTSLAMARGDASAVKPTLRLITVLGLSISAPIGLGMILLAPSVAHYLNLSNPTLIYPLAMIGVGTLLVATNRGALQGLQRFGALSANMVIDMGVRLAATIALIAAGLSAMGAVLAVLLGPLVAYGHSLLLLRTVGGPRDGSASTNVMGLGGYAVAATVVSVGVNYAFSIDVILAKHYLAPQVAGVYAAGSILARVIYFLSLTIAGVMFPEVTALHDRDEGHFHIVERSLILICLLGAAMTACYLLAPGIVLLPYGATFLPVAPFLGAFAVTLSLLAASNLLLNYFLSVDNRRFIAPLVGACALETILIVLFHQNLGQILAMVLLSMGILTGLLAALYLKDRLRQPVPTP